MKRRTPLVRHTRLRSCSPKQGRNLREYFRLRNEFLALHPYCEVGPGLEARNVKGRPSCGRVSNQIHHTCRRGKHLLDVDTWIASCPRCHRWVETHANEARKLGLIKT